MANMGLTAFAAVLVIATMACAPTVPPRVVQSSEAGPAISDLATLARQADLVVVGRVSGPGTTREVPQPLQTPIGPTRVPTGPAASGGGGISVPVTLYSVELERVVRGTAPPGSQISVIQSGNPIRNAVPTQDDVPMRDGERYVLFLQKAADGSNFVVVGGIQGRLAVDAQNRIHPLGSGSPATRDRDGQPLDAFLADVAAT